MEKRKKTCNQDEVTALSDAEVKELLLELPQWSLRNKAIEREFRFRDFAEAIEFVNKLASLSETENHHPDILISYNKVLVALTTHKVAGLSCKDFILGAKIDRLTGCGR